VTTQIHKCSFFYHPKQTSRDRSVMKISLATGVSTVGAWFLLSAVDASYKHRNDHRSSIQSVTTSRSRRRSRSIFQEEDNDNDYDFHRSLSTAKWEGGSGYSSSPSLNDNWDIEESSSYSSFYDFEDLKPYRKKKKKSKKKVIDETEGILRALEGRRREENNHIESRRRSRRMQKRHREQKNNISSTSSLPLKSSKKRRRRKRKDSEQKTKVANAVSTSNSFGENTSRVTKRCFAQRSFVPRTPAATKTQATATSEAVYGSIDSNSSPLSGGNSEKQQTSQPKPHPDRTTWEVPSYSHKISTMMNNKNNGMKPKTTSAASAPTVLPRTTRATSDQNPKLTGSNIGRSGSTVRTTTETVKSSTRSTRKIKPIAMPTSSSQSSTLGSTTTPWVRKFLSGRSKDRLLPLPRDYISDNFNLAQLPPIVERLGYQAMGDDAIPVAKALQQQRIAAAASEASQPSRSSSYPIYRRALQNILADPTSVDDKCSHDEDLIIPLYAIEKASEALYLLLHARFVVSPRGLEAIRHVMALDNTVFGKCPRSNCRGTGLLPYGYSNDYTSDTSVPTVSVASRKERDSCCHRYCPSCGEVWTSWESKTDGCAWGPSWCHLFLLAFGSQIYAKELEAAAAAINTDRVEQSQQQPPQASPLAARTFLPRRGSVVTSGTDRNAISDGSNRGSEDISRPIPSVFGFRIHPSTSFGRPFNEPSLRGGSND